MISRSCSLLLLTLLAVTALVGGPRPARGDTLADFDFAAVLNSADTDPNSDANVGSTSIDLLGIDPGTGNPAPSYVAFTTYSTVGDSRTNDQAFRFTLTPHAGYTLSVTSVSFEIAAFKRSDATADQAVQAFAYTDRDGQSTPVAAGFAIDMTSDGAPTLFATSASTDLSSNPLFQNVAGQIVFSIYVSGTSPQGFVLLDNVRVEGVVAAVPEPSSLVLLGLGSLAAAVGLTCRG